MTTPGKPAQRLSTILPPLIFGCATFNTQYNNDPYALDTVGLVQQAVEYGIRAFDTSPYYGPSEELLGAALDTAFVRSHVARKDIFYITKCGRIAGSEFDYSPEWVCKSVDRSLARLRTDYLDVVYCHDVEFVHGDEVLSAVRELRRIRDESGKIKYVGISGYPLPVLCELAMRIYKETGEPLDAVMSYANFTLQNTTLESAGVGLLKAAGVDVVPNASPLGMGLLRREGVPQGAQGDWHPAGPGLRAAIRKASDFCDRHGERLEVVAIRYALESWITAGESVGSHGDPASGVPWQRESNEQVGGKKLGVSVMGVSKASELEKTISVWRSILDGLEDGEELARKAGRWTRDHEWSLNRKRAVQIMADGVQEHLGEYLDFAWDSPGKDYVNKRQRAGVNEGAAKLGVQASMPTPAASPKAAEDDVPAAELPIR
ncbi:hypothetical protein M8818_007491 [Zalaria obscura]|uniref:Uncharacterized protein n=1 Tax=Zalaria obscura TaxID=2024903 RepID=A0ACC3S7J4_9PEZI